MSSRSRAAGDALTDGIGPEQEYLSLLYGRLDDLRERAKRRLSGLLRESGGTPQARSQRDDAVAMYGERLTRYDAVENGLCFGRLDIDDDEPRYIGRIGLFDDTELHRPLLIDWRAPGARPFYLATAASPEGVHRRRHIRTRGRTVTALDDEVLDLSAAHDPGHSDLTGEAALLSALNASRTGRMSDIVETIQAEQDRVIRSRLSGVLVVQGGPGTGKTAVALHRAAYLLYTHREELTRRGVLIVGPNATFLRYIAQVLPSLAETGVLLRTPGDLFPGVTAERPEPASAAQVKGQLVMTEVLATAVHDRQRLPDDSLPVEVDGYELHLDRETCERARARARRSGRPHNLARPLFATEIVHALSGQIAERIGADPLGGENLLDEADLAEIRRDLRADPAVRAALDWLWPVLTPQRLLADLLTDPRRIASAAPQLAAAARDLLRARPQDGWTAADVPLLDELAELLGEDDTVGQARAQRHRREQIEYAEGVLDIAVGSRSIDLEDELDPELLSATDLVDAGRFAARQETADRRTAAERAAADRTWAFGHIIVDEAQELSPMAWRLLMRRCPGRSMTVVGDVAQTGDLAGTASWRQVLEPYVADRWRLEELTVNYRTPAEIMAVAAEVLTAIDPALRPPRSVRASGVTPWRRPVPPQRLAPEVVDVVLDELTRLGAGRLGVIVPMGRAGQLARAVTDAVPEAGAGERPELQSRVVVLTVRQAKGLEFDTVVVVEPERIVAESPRGDSDLYVALTRATQRLGILHTGALPTGLRERLDVPVG
ncbi:MAG TPA: ATP-binding domain-containing protein [Catenuloplanes sp.]